MKILLVSQQFPPGTALGGIGTQAAAKAAGLRALGHEVHVLSRGASGHSNTEVRRDGVVVTRMPPPALTIHAEAAARMAMSVQAAEWIDRLTETQGPFDVIDIPEYGGEGLVALGNRSEWHHPSILIQVHGTTGMLADHIGWPEPGSPLQRIGSAMEIEAMRLADLVYASSAFSAHWVEDALELERGVVDIWHCGVDTSRFTPPALAHNGPPTIAFVGRVAASKGVDLLLEAVAEARSALPDLRLRLIGPVDHDGQEAIERWPTDHVEVVGPVARENLPATLEGASAFVAPSRFEAGPGLVYLEAMACGLPVIAGDAGGAGEVVIPGQTGVLVPPDNRHRLVEAIVDLLGDPQRRGALAASAREWVVRNADTATLMPRLVSLYERVA